MKRLLKKKIRNTLKGIPLNIYFVNLIFQKVFRIDSQCPFSKNYTSRVLGSEKLYIEDHSLAVMKSLALSGGCYIQACEGVFIGKGTMWSFNVSIISQDHDVENLSKVPVSTPIKIGRNCWIGTGVTILPNIILGDNTIVGANSVVTKSFSQGNVIIAGCPAKVIRERS